MGITAQDIGMGLIEIFPEGLQGTHVPSRLAQTLAGLTVLEVVAAETTASYTIVATSAESAAASPAVASTAESTASSTPATGTPTPAVSSVAIAVCPVNW